MNNKKVLVVEDEVVIAEEILLRLEDMGFDAPVTVSSGEDAIKKSEEISPDLVLMDIQLKGDMDGIEAAEMIHTKLGIPVIYLTAHSDKKTLERAKITEPFGYIVKPFNEKDLKIGIEIALYKHEMEGQLKQYQENLEELVEERTAEIIELKEFNETIVKSIQEGLITEDEEGIVTFANPKMLEITNTSMDGLIGLHWRALFSQESESLISEGNSKVKKGEKTSFEAMLDINGRELHMLVNTTPRFEGDTYVGNLREFLDITEQKEAEEKLRKRALKYKIEMGKSYLILEKVLERGIDVTNDLVASGYSGMVISRTPSTELAENFEEGIDIIQFSEEKSGKGAMPPNLSLVSKSIEDFVSRNRVVMLDRLDYLIVQNSFNEVLKFLNHINEKIILTKSVLMVVVDPETLSKQELSLLEKEIHRVEVKQYIKLDADLLDILEFIKTENGEGRNPVHKDIMNTFSITRPTATKKLKELNSKGLILEKKRGRFKSLEITGKGKSAL